MTQSNKPEVWVFGDWRNYFEVRVTLQLLARGKELAAEIGGRLCAVVLGHDVDEWVWEYTCHGAERVYVIDHPSLADYAIETYTHLMDRLAREHDPQIVLIGATSFGRELAPRLAARLKTGLSADCIDLKIDDQGRLVQIAPSFGGNMLAEIVTPEARPQMATVRPGTFKEIPHNDDAVSERIDIPLPGDLPGERLRLVSSQRQPRRDQNLEQARVVVCGGRGMASRNKWRNLVELARQLGAEVGATRPVVYLGWADGEALIGQAGKTVKPKVLFSFGVSGAIQHTAALNDSEFIIAVNKNPNATMMKLADVAIVADANQLVNALNREIRVRLGREED